MVIFYFAHTFGGVKGPLSRGEGIYRGAFLGIYMYKKINCIEFFLRYHQRATKEVIMAKKEAPAAGAKNPALESALAQIQKQFGKEAIMKMGDGSQQNIEAISSGSLGLDIALGIGGYPRGRIVEIYGPESSGKTTLALHAVAEAQKKGGTCAYIDAENALDPSYAKKLGVDVANLIISQPDSGEQALEIADTLIKSGAVDVVVIDSVAALVPKAELEGNIGDSFVGTTARLMSQSLKKLAGSVSRSNTLLIFINQIRMKIGVMFGNPETTSGGNALKFYASVRLDIRRTGAIKDKENVIGNETRVKVVKNKVAPPFRTVDFKIMYGEGISRISEILDMGVKYNLIEKAGSFYSYNNERIGQGEANARQWLKDHPEAQAELLEKIMARAGGIAEEMTTGPADEEDGNIEE